MSPKVFIKFSLPLFLFLLPSNLFAQIDYPNWSVGVQVGFGLSGYYYDFIDISQYRHGRNIGGYVGKTFTEKIEVKIGFFYEENGYATGASLVTPNGSYGVKDNRKVNYYMGHLQFHYFVLPEKRIYVGSGGYYGSWKNSYFDVRRKTDLGLLFNVGYKQLLWKNFGVELQTLSEIGLVKNIDTAGRNISFQFKAGLFVGF